MEQQLNKQLNKYKEQHTKARDAWIEWTNSSRELSELQSSGVKGTVDVALLKQFGELVDSDYSVNSTTNFLEKVYAAVFRGRRKRTLELGAGSGDSESKFCFGADGLSTRYKYTTHARPINFKKFANLIKNKDALDELVLLAQNKKQHELAMNILQFAKLLSGQVTDGDGIIVELKEPIKIPTSSLHNRTRGAPKEAALIELSYVGDDNVAFNLLIQNEGEYAAADGDKWTRQQFVLYNKVTKNIFTDEHLVDLQLWVQLDHIVMAMKPAIVKYNADLAALKDTAHQIFGRQMLAAMIK